MSLHKIYHRVLLFSKININVTDTMETTEDFRRRRQYKFLWFYKNHLVCFCNCDVDNPKILQQLFF